MKFKWAVLNVLAKWPERRLTFAEIRREVGNIPETGNQVEQARFSELDDIDLLKSGLVLLDDVGLQITDAGLSLLGRLKAPPHFLQPLFIFHRSCSNCSTVRLERRSD